MLRVFRSELPCVAALLACCLGVLVSLLGGAPVSRISLHVAAAGFGVTGYALLRRRLGRGDFRRDLTVVLFALAMLGLTLLATTTHHAQSWLMRAGVQVQTSELFAPLLLVIAAGLLAREYAKAAGVVLLLMAFVQFLAPDLGLGLAWTAGAMALLAGSDRWRSWHTLLALALGALLLGTWLRTDLHSVQPPLLAPLSLGSVLALLCLLAIAATLLVTAFGFAPALVVPDTRASKLAGLALSAYFLVDLSSVLGDRVDATMLSLSPWLGALVGVGALFAQTRAERRLAQNPLAAE